MSSSYQPEPTENPSSGIQSHFKFHAALADRDGCLVVEVFSAILDLPEVWSSTWLTVRALDLDGRGWVDTSYQELAALKGCSTATIRRHIGLGMGKGFRSCNRTSNGIRIYLASLSKVCARYGISDLGGISYELSTSLGRSGSKACSTALLAQHLQRRALYAARKGKSKAERGKVLDAREYIQPSCDSSVRAKRPKYFFCKDGATCPGTSLQGIVKAMIQTCPASARSIRTIKNRLSNRWRLERDLDLIQKRRVAIGLDSIASDIASECGQTFIQLEDKLIKFINGDAYQLGVNVYETSYELRARRFLRARLKHQVQLMN